MFLNSIRPWKLSKIQTRIFHRMESVIGFSLVEGVSVVFLIVIFIRI